MESYGVASSAESSRFAHFFDFLARDFLNFLRLPPTFFLEERVGSGREVIFYTIFGLFRFFIFEDFGRIFFPLHKNKNAKSLIYRFSGFLGHLMVHSPK